MKVFQQGWAARTGAERVLVLANAMAEIIGQFRFRFRSGFSQITVFALRVGFGLIVHDGLLHCTGKGNELAAVR